MSGVISYRDYNGNKYGLNPGDRIEHPTYGGGEIVELNPERALIKLDKITLNQKFPSRYISLTLLDALIMNCGVKGKAEVGDRIVITAPYASAGQYDIGDIIIVFSSVEDGIFNSEGDYIFHHEYFILKGYDQK